MSARSWNRGLDDAANGELMRQNQDEDYYNGFAYGQPVIQSPAPRQPTLDPEESADALADDANREMGLPEGEDWGYK